MSINKEFLNLYTCSVHNFCSNQSELLKFIEGYISIKEGSLSDEFVEEFYENWSNDDEWSRTREDEYGSKRNYVEHKLLDLISQYKSFIQKELNVSFKRLDVLLEVLKG